MRRLLCLIFGHSWVNAGYTNYGCTIWRKCKDCGKLISYDW